MCCHVQVEYCYRFYISVVDPGFPVGCGTNPVWGDTNIRRGCFSVKMYVKMKELGPVGGGGMSETLPGSANAFKSGVVKLGNFSAWLIFMKTPASFLLAQLAAQLFCNQPVSYCK